jgi:hypothetical protein
MRATQSPFDNIEPRLPGRRAWVKSAVLTAASAMALSSKACSEATTLASLRTSNQPSDKSTPAFRNKMVGFMLAHEQFPVAQLIELELPQNKLALTSWLPVTTFSHGKRMKVIAERRGPRWGRSHNARAGCGREPR